MPNPVPDSDAADFEFDFGIDAAPIVKPTPALASTPIVSESPAGGGGAVIRRKAKRAEASAPPAVVTKAVPAPVPAQPPGESGPRIVEGDRIRSPRPPREVTASQPPAEPALSVTLPKPEPKPEPKPAPQVHPVSEPVHESKPVSLPTARRDLTTDAIQPVANPFANQPSADPSALVDDLDLEEELLAPPRGTNPVAREAPSSREVPAERSQSPASLGDEHRDVERREYRRPSSRSGGTGQRIVVAAAIAAAAAGVVAFMIGRGGDDEGDAKTVDGGGSSAKISAPAKGSPMALPKAGESDEAIKERIVGCLFRFFGANSAAELLPVVRFPERVGPLMNDYYARVPFAMPRFLDLVDAEEGMIALKPFWEVKVALEGGQTRPMALQDTADGFRVDWEIFVHYNPMAWPDYAKQRPAEKLQFRVYARKDYNPGYAFPEVDGWTCLELSAHGSGEKLFGYAEKGSELGQRLEEMLRDEYSKDCILTLQFPEDPKGGDQQVWIRELVSKDWIRAE